MSKSNTFENHLLLLVFNNTNIALVGDATGLRGSSTAGSLYVSLHGGDPGEAGDQTTNEVGYAPYNTHYTQYARQAVARSGAGWTVTGASVSPAAAINFPQMSSGSNVTITHFGVGTDSTGTGKLLYKGTVNPNITVANGVTPQLTTATAITED